jgi:hypothetical protein
MSHFCDFLDGLWLATMCHTKVPVHVALGP